MANTLKIKRSAATVIPVSLAEGELAYSEKVGTKLLYIGTNGGADIETIGGKAIVDKVNGIESGADVTDATNVAAAGAVMEADTSTALMSFVVDEDNMASNLDTKVPTQQSVKAYADTKLPLAGGTLSNYLTLHADPSSALHAVTKQYVDARAAGLDPKEAVDVATTANITLSGEQTIDTVLTSASRVLVKNQAAPAENGIYVSAAGAWARAADMDATAEASKGSYTVVSGGSANLGKVFFVSTAPAILGTNDMVWSTLSATPSGGVLLTDFDANTILAADTDNTPTARTIAEEQIVGRITAGNIKGLSATEVRTMINVESGADVTDATNVAAAGAVMESDYTAKGVLLTASAASTLSALTVGTNDTILMADSTAGGGLKWTATLDGGTF